MESTERCCIYRSNIRCSNAACANEVPELRQRNDENTHYKVKVGKQLKSEAILSDAACTRACLQLSIVLLIASVGYELTLKTPKVIL